MFAFAGGREAVGWQQEHPSAAHGDEVMAAAGGVVEVVEDEHDGALIGGVEVDEEVEHIDLMGEVEKCRRFVESITSVPWAKAMAIHTSWRCPPDSSLSGRAGRSTVPVAPPSPP